MKLLPKEAAKIVEFKPIAISAADAPHIKTSITNRAEVIKAFGGLPDSTRKTQPRPSVGCVDFLWQKAA